MVQAFPPVMGSLLHYHNMFKSMFAIACIGNSTVVTGNFTSTEGGKDAVQYTDSY